MISRLELDYCRASAATGIGRYALLATLLIAAHVGTQYWSLRQDIALLEARLSATSAKRSSGSVGTQTIDAAEYSSARETIRQLSTPWGSLFRALERARSDQIALLSIQPNAENRTLTVTGEAKDYLATLTYLARLDGEEPLKRVHLLHHETRRENTFRAVAFTISAGWKDDE